MSFLPSIRATLSSLLFFAALAPADLIPYIADEAYDHGDFGSYPYQEYQSSALKGPRVNILATSDRCSGGDDEFIFLNPRGRRVVPGPNPMILDQAGNLVWTLDGKPYGETYNLNVQEWNGEQYLTFWGGNDAVGGHGQGYYYMFDSTYTQVRQISAVGPIKGDLHEFRFTGNGTALLTVYEITAADLSPIGGPARGWVWDGAFQEIDLATGNLLFTWKSTDHYAVNETYHEYGSGGDSASNPFDYFHINSVDKDDLGNYLISARYTHSVTYIDGRTGAVLWQLGGKRNAFADLSDGRATDFAWQHDARWHANNTAITLFDNGAEAGRYTAPHSRGMRIAVDQAAMTARLVTEYVHPTAIISSSQGSLQVLANGNVLLGYGYNGAYTEYSANGAVLCDTHFGAQSRFESGDVQSYRAQKRRWTGRPTTKPDIKVEGSSVYASWNGATEVHRWVLQDADYAELDGAEAGDGDLGEAWFPVQTVEKAGFETELRFGVSVRRYVRVLALDREGRVLAASEPGGTRIDDEIRNSTMILGMRIKDGDATILTFLVCAGMVATGVVVVMAWRSRLDRIAYEKILDEEKEDVVEVGEEEEALLDRQHWRVGS
ncbi:Arylsulfotransferase [Neofusicoccum parvum]|uniref:Arylsulfotransferase n=1 Tax=Neofusicoccum parvum TaxID=310453 RepID=A0ACB5RZD3_9PEZI|nr:Arylsulfotransferase [Neofusicoccum parvum]GME35925.1 Arylsulfotransferase [Neofusicoccum parvum]